MEIEVPNQNSEKKFTNFRALIESIDQYNGANYILFKGLIQIPAVKKAVGPTKYWVQLLQKLFLLTEFLHLRVPSLLTTQKINKNISISNKNKAFLLKNVSIRNPNVCNRCVDKIEILHLFQILRNVLLT